VVKFQQRYQKSHRSFRNLLCSKNFRQFCGFHNWLLFSRPFGGLIPTVFCKRSSEKSYSPRMGHRTGSVTGRGSNRRIRRLSRGQHLMDPQRCQNHGPVRLLVPLLEFNPPASRAMGYRPVLSGVPPDGIPFGAFPTAGRAKLP
jgi:hypothetical protein